MGIVHATRAALKASLLAARDGARTAFGSEEAKAALVTFLGRISAVCSEYGVEAPPGPPAVIPSLPLTPPPSPPETDLADIFDGIELEPVTMNSTARYGEVSLYELFVLSAVAKFIKAKRIFEIGTFEGNTTYNLALNTEPETAIFTLDLPEESKRTQSDLEMVKQYSSGAVTGRRFRGGPMDGKIRQLLGDSSAYDFGPFEGSIDLVFVDGDHSYDYVKSDTRNALKMLASPASGTACIFWHDCDPGSDVERVLNEELPQKWCRIADTRLGMYLPERR